MMTALEKAARALHDWSQENEGRVFPPYEQWSDEWNAGARAVLMAVIPELQRWEPDADGYGWYGMSEDSTGQYVHFDDLQAILNEEPK